MLFILANWTEQMIDIWMNRSCIDLPQGIQMDSNLDTFLPAKNNLQCHLWISPNLIYECSPYSWPVCKKKDSLGLV